MKKINFIWAGALSLAALCITSCSDDFLQEMKNYDKVTVELYNDYSGAVGRLSELMARVQPEINTKNPSHKSGSYGWADDWSKCTEEYTGFGLFVNPEKELNTVTGKGTPPDYFQKQNNSIHETPWGYIRQANDIIAGVTNGSMSQADKDKILGQVYFWRAWTYYRMFMWYGGIPIITEVMEPAPESVVPRSSAKEVYEFIIDDLNKSAELLAPFTANGGWESPENLGFVTAGTALGFKTRVMLMWCSPLFNRKNDPARWEAAYQEAVKDLPTIDACGYGLAYEDNPGVNAAGWAKMFSDVSNNKEALLFTLYNDRVSGLTPDYHRNNPWEQAIRPKNAYGSNGIAPSSMIFDMFPMADGKKPSACGTYYNLPVSDIDYNIVHPFMNRDPRFYRTFAFPGVMWQYDKNFDVTYTPKDDGTRTINNNPYAKGNEFVLWNYVWYADATEADKVDSGNSYGADNLMGGTKGIYIRKRSDDYEVNKTPRYNHETSRNFSLSYASYIELRYAEVLLNIAELACGANQLSVAENNLKRIRARVGYTEENNYGLLEGMNQQTMMSAILYERQIELAFEGKRFDDMRRWLLFDGGTKFNEIEDCPQTWLLEGWNGNTCEWLGFTPFNGQRREGLQYRVQPQHNNGLGGKEWKNKGGQWINGAWTGNWQSHPDPLVELIGGANSAEGYATFFNKRAECAIDLSKPLEGQQEKLAEFYANYLVRKETLGDGRSSTQALLYINFLPRYYLLGFDSSAQNKNETLPQTIGWEDALHGGANGTFDPLAE